MDRFKEGIYYQNHLIRFDEFRAVFLKKLSAQDFDHFSKQWSLREIDTGGYEQKKNYQLSASLEKYLDSCLHAQERRKKQKRDPYHLSTREISLEDIEIETNRPTR